MTSESIFEYIACVITIIVVILFAYGKQKTED